MAIHGATVANGHPLRRAHRGCESASWCRRRASPGQGILEQEDGSSASRSHRGVQEPSPSSLCRSTGHRPVAASLRMQSERGSTFQPEATREPLEVHGSTSGPVV